jgi:prophage regulatory protein
MNQSDTNKLLRIREVCDLTSLAKSTIWLWVSQDRFPKPISLSPSIKVWRQSDIDSWVDAHT